MSEAAGALVALAGVGLLALARGVRRGQRSAWLVSILLLSGTVALHLIRHGEVFQSVAALALVAMLWLTRDSFRARFDLPSLRTGLATLLVGVLAVTFIGATVIWSVLPTHRHGSPSHGRRRGGRRQAGSSASARCRSIHAWTPSCTPPSWPSASGWRRSPSCSRSARSSTAVGRVAGPTQRIGLPTSSGAEAPARSTTSHCEATRSPSSSATASWRTRSTAASASSHPIPSARPRNAMSSGRRFADSRTTTDGRWRCSGRVRHGCPSTGGRECTSATSATRASWTCGHSRWKVAPARASGKPLTGSPSTATRSRSMTRPVWTRRSRTRCGAS